MYDIIRIFIFMHKICICIARKGLRAVPSAFMSRGAGRRKDTFIELYVHTAVLLYYYQNKSNVVCV